MVIFNMDDREARRVLPTRGLRHIGYGIPWIDLRFSMSVVAAGCSRAAMGIT